ncbi:MAG: acetyltransferase [Pseudonocardiaceae bacterium]|nr:acetyltransferase [Pseudonocardiaceae bacterium]
MGLDDATTDSYLHRIGAERPDRLDVTALRNLQERHVMSIPFENVDCYCRRPLGLGQAAAHKIVHRHRGGGCYEQNSAFGLLLRSLGYSVTIMGASVYHGENLLGPLRHLVLRVDTPEPWLVDVAFGFGRDRNSRFPLRLDEPSTQPDPHGTYQLRAASNDDIDVIRDGTPLYRLERRPRTVEDFELTLWWFHTNPDSPMLQALFCLLPTETGRVALKDRTLTHIDDGAKTSVELEDEDEVRAALAKYFGISLTEIPDFGKTRHELANIIATEITSDNQVNGASAA